ncbi:hypothetical protein FIBSPDRAFT_954157 [Athelia psychrophila]|uniref:DUF6533 domain-containing protein n=1 Tax=Athelia psychrophila TaxID=1759441 RepID=A0A166JKZ4_9AGAM|nr:hypothetical protein FIBSPDRAFT_954157 [Fibularhizoctonia sp. CBS 109695]
MSLSSAELASIVKDVQNARFATLAASVIIVFDHLITLDQEIELVWRSPWTTGKLLFFLNRYYPLSTVVFNQYVLFKINLTDELYVICTSNKRLSWFRWQGWSGLIAVMVAEIILQLRIYALYFLNKKVLFVVASFFIISTASAATIMGLVLSNIAADATSIAGVNFCMPLHVPRYIYAYWIPILAFESLLCGMSIFRGFQAFRQRQSVFQSGKHLMTILLRDSIVYFLIIFVTYLVNCLLWATGAVGLLEIPVGFTMAMSCVMGSRLVLNIRFMKRELELGIHNRQRNILHLPFNSRSATILTPVVFAGYSAGSTGDSGSIPSAEYIEMREASSRESPSDGPLAL